MAKMLTRVEIKDVRRYIPDPKFYRVSCGVSMAPTPNPIFRSVIKFFRDQGADAFGYTGFMYGFKEQCIYIILGDDEMVLAQLQLTFDVKITRMTLVPQKTLFTIHVS